MWLQPPRLLTTRYIISTSLFPLLMPGLAEQDLPGRVNVCLLCFNGSCLDSDQHHTYTHTHKTTHLFTINIKRCLKLYLTSPQGLALLCMTCGSLGCSRWQFGRLGGNRHGFAHYQQTGHTVGVTLGMITPEGSAGNSTSILSTWTNISYQISIAQLLLHLQQCKAQSQPNSLVHSLLSSPIS